jgi:hypothetical protein
MSGFGPGAPPSTLIPVGPLPNGWFQFNMQVNPGWNYQLQTSTNLIDWTTLIWFTPTSDIWPYTDTAAPYYPQRFYRLVVP